MFLKEDITIGWRNPISFINQWYDYRNRTKAIFIWLFYFWKSNMCDVWISYGVRICGVEISYKKYL